MRGSGELLLISGGLDSTCIAWWRRPAGALFVDYGQKPAAGELTAARAVTEALGIALSVLRVDCSPIGSGLLAGSSPLASVSPSPEWWPFRNQLVVTLAAAWAVLSGFDSVVIGCVSTDAARHADGSRAFLHALDDLVRMQEGGIRVVAPALDLTSVELAKLSAAPSSLLGWTHSCHVDSIACGTCPGCVKRSETLYPS
jgi:7-cyano-7-deazaguanine synthase